MMIGLTTATALSTIGRVGREPSLQTAALLAAAPATAAGLHAVGVKIDIDAKALSDGLSQSQLWLVLGMTAIFGAIGGFVAELLSLHGNIELPHRTRRRGRAKRMRLADPNETIDLGIFSRMLVGSAAALALLSVYAPQAPTVLLVNALIAGSAGTAVFRLVQSRLIGRAETRRRQSEPRELRAVPQATESKVA
jgi:hypothetical protein